MKLSALALSVALSATPSWSFTTTTAHPAFGIVSTTRQSQQHQSSQLYGILDEVASGAYDLGGKGTTDGAADEDGGTQVDMNNSFEMFLAELVFSTNNPRVDIANNLEKCTDPEWLKWLDNKIDTSTDPEERSALRDLYEMISDIVQRMEVSQLAQEREEQEVKAQQEKDQEAAAVAAEEGKSLSKADLLKKAQAIDQSVSLDQDTLEEIEKEASKTFYEQELTPEIRLSYQKLLKDVLPPYEKAGATMESTVQEFYNQFDAQFVKLLTEEAQNGKEDAQKVLECLSKAQQEKVQIATESLKRVLSAGDPMRMEGQILQLAREGKIDEPFLLLLEANVDQAKAAGAQGPAELMEKLRRRAMDEKDKQASSKEVRLIRKLLRAETADERTDILEEAFTPKEQLLVPGTAENARKAVDGEVPEQEKPVPDVQPPDFINACKAVLLNFGNLGLEGSGSGDSDLAARIKVIASEAEVVATRIYGQGMSPKEQQDRAWKEQTTSIFDLEQMEIEAEQRGESAPWSNPDAPDDVMPGFDANGRMQVGGG